MLMIASYLASIISREREREKKILIHRFVFCFVLFCFYPLDDEIADSTILWYISHSNEFLTQFIGGSGGSDTKEELSASFHHYNCYLL